MVKKIGVFIMILGLFFVGMPQYTVNAETYYSEYQVLNVDYDEGYQNGYNDGFDDGFDEGEDFGFNAGFNQGQLEGYEVGYDAGISDGYWDAYADGKDYGYNEGYNLGYNKGINETDATGFVALLSTVFGGLGALLSIELLPGIYIGAIIAVPLVFGIIFFILGKRKGD